MASPLLESSLDYNLSQPERHIESLSGSGWLLHPKSIKTIKQSQTAYLARPGFPGLIEVQEKTELVDKPLFVNEILLKMDSSMAGLLKHIGLELIIKVTKEQSVLLLGEHKIQLQDLWQT